MLHVPEIQQCLVALIVLVSSAIVPQDAFARVDELASASADDHDTDDNDSASSHGAAAAQNANTGSSVDAEAKVEKLSCDPIDLHIENASTALETLPVLIDAVRTQITLCPEQTGGECCNNAGRRAVLEARLRSMERLQTRLNQIAQRAGQVELQIRNALRAVPLDAYVTTTEQQRLDATLRKLRRLRDQLHAATVAEIVAYHRRLARAEESAMPPAAISDAAEVQSETVLTPMPIDEPASTENAEAASRAEAAKEHDLTIPMP